MLPLPRNDALASVMDQSQNRQASIALIAAGSGRCAPSPLSAALSRASTPLPFPRSASRLSARRSASAACMARVWTSGNRGGRQTYR